MSQYSNLFQAFKWYLSLSEEPLQMNEITSYDVLSDQLATIAELEPKKFALNIDSYLSNHSALLETFTQEGTTLSICSSLMECVVSVCQRHPSIISKNQQRLFTIVQRLFQLFIKLDIKSDEAWCNPPEGYNAENDFSEENNLTKQIMAYFDRIASSLGFQKFVAFMSQILPGWFNNTAVNSDGQTEFKTTYALLMVMSQLGEDNQQPLQLQSFVEFAIKNSTHSHPKVRYAVLHMLGQISDDMKPGFQVTYGQAVLPVVMNLTLDPLPVIRGHCVACLTNFLQDFKDQNFHILAPHVQNILSTCQNFIMNGNSTIKENTISSLASFSTITMITEAHVQKIIQIIKSILSNPTYNSQLYDQLINQTIECLSMIIYGQPKNISEKYLDLGVNVIKQLQDRLSRSYLSSAWSRICLKYPNTSFTDLSNIFPKILQSVFEMIRDGQAEVQSALNSILYTISAFRSDIKPYASQIIQFIRESLPFISDDDKIKQNVFSIVDELITNLKSQAPDPNWENLAKQILEFLIEQIKKILQGDPSNSFVGLQEALKGPQKVISHLAHMFTPQVIDNFVSTLMDFTQQLNQIIDNKNQLINQLNVLIQNGDQFQKDDSGILKKDYEQSLTRVLDSRLIIPDIYDSIVKVANQQKKIELIKYAQNHISPYTSNQNNFNNLRYGLYYLCNFVDMGYNYIAQNSMAYEQTFLKYSLSSEIFVRNSAIYGLGSYMREKPVSQISNESILKWLTVAKQSLDLTNSEDLSKRESNFARDNIVSAIGKLLKFKSEYFPKILDSAIFQTWVSYMPLNTDKEEGDHQQQFLLQILMNKPEILVQTKESLQKVLTIMAKYLSKRKVYTAPIYYKNKQLTLQVLTIMKNWPLFNENSQFLWQHLSSNYQKLLLDLTNGN